MPHVSKQKLDDKKLQKLYAKLVQLIAPKQSADASSILSDLLTETEKVMLAKRLAAILLIAEQVSMYKIATRLKLSSSTVQQMYRHYQAGAYDELLSVLKRRKGERERMWELIELIARAGMPPMGKHRWKSVL